MIMHYKFVSTLHYTPLVGASPNLQLRYSLAQRWTV